MKRLLIIAVVFVSCNSTQNNIESSVKNIERERLSSNDGQVDNIDIDSLSYKSVSLQDYYAYKQLEMMKTWADIVKIRMDMYHLGKPQNLDSIKTENEKHKIREREFDSLQKSSGSTINIYEVKYLLKAKTSKNSYNNNKTIFLYQKDLKPVDIN